MEQPCIDGTLITVKINMSKIKQVIVLRKDLNMRKGKCVAQGCHASVQVCLDLQVQWTERHEYNFPGGKQFEKWCDTGMTKICVSVDSEQELLDVFEKAKRSGIAAALIQDAGHTEFAGVPTYTCCAIGPDKAEHIDPITSALKLL